jgi:hypothetical protein
MGILLISVYKFECISERIVRLYRKEKNSLTHSNLHTEMSKKQGKLDV